MKRFSNEYWIIHDISRNKAIIYDTNKYEIIELLQDDCKSSWIIKMNIHLYGNVILNLLQ